MSVPMSQYEALLEEVRCLRRKAQHVQQLAAPLIASTSAIATPPGDPFVCQIHRNAATAGEDVSSRYSDLTMESLLILDAQGKTKSPNEHERAGRGNDGDATGSEDECGRAHMSVSSEPISQKTRGMVNLYHGTWPVERTMLWNSDPTNLGPINTLVNRMDQTSVMSFASSSGGAPLDRVLSSPDRSRRSSQQLEAKMDMVYSLLAMLGGQEHADMGETLLALSTSPESCLAMRQSGCIPLLVQLVQSDKDGDTRKKASQALHNLVHAQPDEKLRKRETRVLKLVEQARLYTEALVNNTEYVPEVASTSDVDADKHPVLTVAHLMKLSFDEGHRQAICQLGGIRVIACLVETEHSLHDSTMDDTQCVLMRRYACMALTNLTFGDSGNKALLCSFREFMRALVVQLQSPSDELRQVTASVLRNLSWRADPVSKEILREVGTVTGLMKAAMVDSKENTLKSILSALWNLSAHCTENKAEICAIDGALGFLVDMLSYKTPSKSLAVIENSGGILRNISSQIAVREDYREILRTHDCLQVLLEQLKSPSLTIVSNACGTLWNLSAKNAQDQETLWQMGAPSMLRSLNHSKHKMIAMGSSAALKNLLSSRPTHSLLPQLDATARAMDLPVLPTLGARKQKALLQDLDQNLLETFDNVESPTKISGDEKFEKYIPTNEFLHKTRKKQVLRSESHECVSHSELVYESRTSRSDSSGRNDVLRRDETRRDERMSRRDDYLARKTDNNDDLCKAFSSLNIGEASTSYQNDFSGKSRLVPTYGSSSLPYVGKCPGYMPARNKYSDFEDEIEVSDQPIDFSRKYAEIKPPNVEKTKDNKKPYTKDNPPNTYGIYAETDLDQPTDYSLRYAEDDSDSDNCERKSEFVQDTIKTYCTEGTPYETPFNFSTATSMSDLRMEEKVIDNDKHTTIENKEVKPSVSHLDEKDHCSVEDISEIESKPKNNPDKALKSEFSSGMMSPEKPVNYCEEGTPGYFSRVSSFGSLNSIPANEKKDESPKDPISETVVKADNVTNEGTKAVKFEQTVNYAEETPLMFSRSSSLASLDSVEQHSIHDDRSSVISDLSRLTSGIVSPSELPDSPTQTVPPSPKPRKGPLEYPSSSRGAPNLFTRTAADGRPQPAPRSIQKPSVFEDNVTKFKEESTPVQFSTATSLSSLTIDDHDEPTTVQIKVSPPMSQHSESTISAMASGGEPSVKQDEEVEKQDTEREKQNGSSELNEDFVHISEDDGDDDILADCINIGMLNNRHRQSKENITPSNKIPTATFKYSAKPQPRPQGSGIPMPKTGIPTRCSPGTSRIPAKPDVPPDSIRTYCTEDTPAVMSHAGSNSDLSVLSIPNDTRIKKDYLSDDSSNLSGDNENLLAECIQSAMPKPKKPMNKPLSPRQIPMLVKNVTTSTPIKPFNRESMRNDLKGKKDEYKKSKVPMYMSPKEEPEKFAIENSPCHFSLRSSLSDLTVDGSIAGLARTPTHHSENNTPTTTHHKLSKSKESTSVSIGEDQSNLSRQESLSSLSVESVGSLETEQALLEQCISSGMPKSKTEVVSIGIKSPEKPVGVATKQFNNANKIKYENETRKDKEKSEGGIGKEKKASNSKNVYVASAVENTVRIHDNECPETTATIAGVNHEEDPDKGPSLNPVTTTVLGTTQVDTSRAKYSLTIENSSIDLKKNGFETTDSLYDQSESFSMTLNDSKIICEVKSDKQYNLDDKHNLGKIELKSVDSKLSQSSQHITDSEKIESLGHSNVDHQGLESENGIISNEVFNLNFDIETEPSNFPESHLKANDTYKLNLDSDHIVQESDSDEDLGKIVNNRMLDPDAMIESLDRFTAELVSQAACHLQNKEESKIQTSVTDGDTWNDDTSPNDVTFPSISGSTPNIITFESDSNELNQDEQLEQIEGIDQNIDTVDGLNGFDEIKSNDFSSLNTSTLTESTLIAMEATRLLANFKIEDDMSQSAASLELDLIQPPSHLNSMTNSINESEIKSKCSPKLVRRKKSLPAGLMVRRALSNSLNQATSLESLENHSLSNLDHMNPPSVMGELDLVDLESSMTSVASLQSEVADIKTDFLMNGVVTKEETTVNPIFQVKQPLLHLLSNNSHCSELENINPPSIFNEITDMCNSLADFPTVCSEAENFEDCDTHFETTLQENDTLYSDATSVTPIQTDVSSNESTPKKALKLLTAKQRRNLAKERYKTYTVEADILKVSNAEEADLDDCIKSATNSAEQNVSMKSLKITPKERRQSNRSRFETQVLDDSVCSILRMNGNINVDQSVSEGPQNCSQSDDSMCSTLKTELSNCESLTATITGNQHFKVESFDDILTGTSDLLCSPVKNCPRFDIQSLDDSISNILRRNDCQIIDDIINLSDYERNETPTDLVSVSVNNSDESIPNSPLRNKVSVRRNFLQKRLENKDRFRTKTISESSLSPDIQSASPTDLHLLLQKEANLVLKTLNETKSRADELLDCETLSLVSNEDDSEHNSGCSINYRTYHKSWGFSGNNIPVIQSTVLGKPDLEDCNSNLNVDRSIEDTINCDDQNSDSESNIEVKTPGKPKIVKPTEKSPVIEDVVDEEEPKGIRGRRKPLYVKSNMRTIPKGPRNSNLSNVKSVAALKNDVVSKTASKLKKLPTAKPPIPQITAKSIKPPMNYGTAKVPNSPKHISPVRVTNKSPKNSPQKSKSDVQKPKSKQDTTSPKPSLERQGTFTKEDSISPKSRTTTSNIPTPSVASSIPKPSSRIARAVTQTNSSVAKTINRLYNGTNRQNSRNGLMKSASTDRANKNQTSPNRIFNRSPSADTRDVVKRNSLQTSSSNQSLKSGAVKRASAPESTQRSSSNSSVTSSGSGKQITSRIASLWKKVEESKKQMPKNDSRVWIQTNSDQSTNEGSPRLIRSNTFDNKDAVLLRTVEIDSTKRVSRLGSFVAMDESETRERLQYQCNSIVSQQSPEVTF